MKKIFILLVTILLTQIVTGQTETDSVLQADSIYLHQHNPERAKPQSAEVDFLSSIMGDEISHGQFMGLIVWALIGATVWLLIQGSKGAQKSNNNTPLKFHVVFLIADNWKRMLLTLLLIFAFIRFYNYATVHVPAEYSFIVGLPKELVSLFFGFLLDIISQKIKSKLPMLQVDRSKLMP